MKLTTDRVLRALARFDSATTADVAEALHCHQRNVWAQLQKLVAEGLVTKDDSHYARYSITEAGRAAIARAA